MVKVESWVVEGGEDIRFIIIYGVVVGVMLVECIDSLEFILYKFDGV